jgi:hypothetical protein
MKNYWSVAFENVGLTACFAAVAMVSGHCGGSCCSQSPDGQRLRKNQMSPTTEEIDAAIAEEAAAMKQFSEASRRKTAASLKVKAAGTRLRNARAAKSALVQDMMAYGG